MNNSETGIEEKLVIAGLVMIAAIAMLTVGWNWITQCVHF
jgi:hypothetical protein